VVRLVLVTGGSLTRKPNRSLRCLLVEVPRQITEYLNLRLLAGSRIQLAFHNLRLVICVVSVAERVKAPFLWRPCDHNHVTYVQLPPSSQTLLRPWIRRFTTIISAWWLPTSNKLSGIRSQRNNLKTLKWTSKRVRMIRPNIALTSLSGDRRIKMEQNKQTKLFMDFKEQQGKKALNGHVRICF